MSAISKRLFLGTRKISSPGADNNDDNASVTSDTSVNTTDNGWMNRLRSSNDPSLDEMMKSMYQDPDILEEKCKVPFGGSAKTNLRQGGGADVAPTSQSGAAGTGGKGMEDRAARRSSSVSVMTKSPEYVVEHLHAEFFSPEFDPVLHQLHAIETWDRGELMERFMSTIEDTDTDKDMVLVKLAEMIETNYSELMGCMRDVHAIDLDLARAGFQVTNSRRKLQSGQKLMVTGTLDIARLQRHRSNLAQVSDILSRVQGIQNLFSTLQNCITIGDVGTAAASAQELLLTLQHDYYDEAGGVGGVLAAVEHFAESVQRLLPTIRQKTDKALFRLAGRKFSAVEYENILRAYSRLDDMQHDMGVCVSGSGGASDEAVDPAVLFDEDGCLEGFARRLQRYHMSDIGACLHTAVLEVLYAAQNERAAAADACGDPPPDQVDLDELSLDDLYERVMPEMFVPCIVRSCELLAEVVHTNYLVTQWHRLPFDQRNHQDEFLHRCAIDGNDSEDEKEDEKEGEKEDAGEQQLEQQEQQRRERLTGARLFSVNEKLTRSRFELWKEVEMAIVGFLHILSPTEVIDLEDFVCMLWALQTFCRLGQEFGGTTCSPLKGGIEEASLQYARSIHVESCQLLHQMLSSEPWRSVPVQLGELGGILGVLRMTLLREQGGAGGKQARISLKGMRDEALARSKHRASVTVASRATLAAKYSSSSPGGDAASTASQGQLAPPLTSFLSSADAAAGDRNILMKFHSHGNPFRSVVSSSSSSSSNSSATEQVSGDDAAKGGGDTHLSCLTGMLSALLADEQGGGAPSKRAQERTAAMVVTQTCVHGLAKFSGQYLQLMQLLPCAACDIFDGLCHLFDFYLYAVFVSFVSAEDRQHLFSKKTRSTAPPPQQAQEFEALKTCMQALLSHAGDKHSDKAAAHMNPFVSLRLLRELGVPPAVQQAEHSTFFALNERIVAAESCWFAAKVLSELSAKLLSLLPEDYRQKVKYFVSDYQQVADQLRSLIYRTMCPVLIDQTNLMHQLVEQSGWDQKKMREEPHEWVDVLVSLCTEVWEYMEEGDEFAEASALVREQVWMELCQCAFDTVLEGLSRVRKCSTEGRASMTMDISALHSGLDSVHVCRPPRGKQYVDNYVKALYLSDEETVHWAQQSWQSYSQRHLHGLLQQALSSSLLKKKRLKDSLDALDALYEQNDFDI